MGTCKRTQISCQRIACSKLCRVNARKFSRRLSCQTSARPDTPSSGFQQLNRTCRLARGLGHRALESHATRKAFPLKFMRLYEGLICGFAQRTVRRRVFQKLSKSFAWSLSRRYRYGSGLSPHRPNIGVFRHVLCHLSSCFLICLPTGVLTHLKHLTAVNSTALECRP